jgi:hypothetical protein
MTKKPLLRALIDKQSEIVRGKPIEYGKCRTCDNDITRIDGNPSFRNAISTKEFLISGMCQSCQDDIYGLDEESEL